MFKTNKTKRDCDISLISNIRYMASCQICLLERSISQRDPVSEKTQA